MVSEPTPPELPEADLERGGWRFVDETTEVLSSVLSVRVVGTTRRYEDERTRNALSVATGEELDHSVRFFAATRLGFEPSLPPGAGQMMAPIVRNEIRKSFESRLHKEGLDAVKRRGSERIRVADRRRAHLTRYTATDPLPAYAETLSVECWVAVWTDPAVTVVTGGYPSIALATQFDLKTESGPLTRSPDEYREEFVSLLRSVE